MQQVGVVTDSCASLPEGLISQLRIDTVAYYIHRGGEILRDLVTIQRDEFLRWLPKATVLPTTASPGPGDYLEKYKEIASRGIKRIVSIHMTSEASGAYQAAKIAQSLAGEQLPDVHIEVIDTRNASLCQGWIAIEAARAASAGAGLEEVVSKIQGMIPLVHMIQTADTLRYLYLGGRIGKAKHLVGSILNIKPLIGMKDGVIVALGQARSRMQAYTMMADMVSEIAGTNKIKIAYVHAGALEEVEKIKRLIEMRLEVLEWFFAELSPVLAVHTGPGTAGLCFYSVPAGN